VDVEEAAPFADMASVAAQFFSPVERRSLGATAGRCDARAFFCCWTRKEAYLKADGIGLFAPLDCFDVSVLPDEYPALLRVAGDPYAPGRWSLRHLEPARSYIGAVAVAMAEPILHCRAWAG
jgi:4'-phosphopantetheinyl transferase